MYPINMNLKKIKIVQVFKPGRFTFIYKEYILLFEMVSEFSILFIIQILK